jgi:hypothetical protein
MSRDAKLAVVGTIAFMAWSVTVALSLEPIWLRAALVLAASAIPVVLWWIAARLRARGSARADAVVIAGLSAEFVMMAFVDALSWAVTR